MSRQLGYFDDDVVRDFPHLNKCPDCETFFESESCPLCGKACPEEMRAGNRKPVKVKKRRRPRNNGRVQFVPWYLSTWFIILMLFVQPIIGLVLLWVGYWQRPAKIIVTVLFVLYTFGFVLLGGIVGFLQFLFFKEELPVNTQISQTEYMETCVALSAESVYREAEARIGEYVVLTLEVKDILNDAYEADSSYVRYYECTAVENGRTWRFLVRDFSTDAKNLAVSDRITVYGQIGGNTTIYDNTAGECSAPLVNMLYVTIEN